MRPAAVDQHRAVHRRRRQPLTSIVPFTMRPPPSVSTSQSAMRPPPIAI
jgi:hypothetical protein